MRAFLVATLSALSCACSATPWEPEPTPEFLAERPQRIAVSEPFGGGDAIDGQVREELRARLPALGYELGASRADADAELRFYVTEMDTGRGLGNGVARAKVVLDGELLGRAGTVLWQGHAAGLAYENDDEPEDEDTRHGVDGILFGMVFDGVVDSIWEPDYDTLLESAAEDAAKDLLGQLPRRVAREETPPPPAR